MNWLNMFRKKALLDELFLHFSAKVQNLAVFSFIYMIRIRFFGPGGINLESVFGRTVLLSVLRMLLFGLTPQVFWLSGSLS